MKFPKLDGIALMNKQIRQRFWGVSSWALNKYPKTNMNMTDRNPNTPPNEPI
jgi:hypothetical protein